MEIIIMIRSNRKANVIWKRHIHGYAIAGEMHKDDTMLIAYVVDNSVKRQLEKP